MKSEKLFDNEVEASHPILVDTDIAYKADSAAMELIHNRHSKRDLVNLIRWLIMDSANIVHEYIKNKNPA